MPRIFISSRGSGSLRCVTGSTVFYTIPWSGRKNGDENSERKFAWVFGGASGLSWRSFGANSQFPQTKSGDGASHWADRKRKDHDALHHARYFEQAGGEYFNRRRSD